LTASGIDAMTVQELAARRADDAPAPCPVVLDVREHWERQIAALPDDVHIPMNEVPQRLAELREHQGRAELVVLCHHGTRSMAVARFLQQNGFTRVINLTGGIDAWSQQIDKSVHLY
jgi:rhodanese-related sulfurtransferase